MTVSPARPAPRPRSPHDDRHGLRARGNRRRAVHRLRAGARRDPAQTGRRRPPQRPQLDILLELAAALAAAHGRGSSSPRSEARELISPPTGASRSSTSASPAGRRPPATRADRRRRARHAGLHGAGTDDRRRGRRAHGSLRVRRRRVGARHRRAAPRRRRSAPAAGARRDRARRCLHPDRERRFASGAELLSALRGVTDGAPGAGAAALRPHRVVVEVPPGRRRGVDDRRHRYVGRPQVVIGRLGFLDLPGRARPRRRCTTTLRLAHCGSCRRYIPRSLLALRGRVLRWVVLCESLLLTALLGRASRSRARTMRRRRSSSSPPCCCCCRSSSSNRRPPGPRCPDWRDGPRLHAPAQRITKNTEEDRYGGLRGLCDLCAGTCAWAVGRRPSPSAGWRPRNPLRIPRVVLARAADLPGGDGGLAVAHAHVAAAAALVLHDGRGLCLRPGHVLVGAGVGLPGFLVHAAQGSSLGTGAMLDAAARGQGSGTLARFQWLAIFTFLLLTPAGWLTLYLSGQRGGSAWRRLVRRSGRRSDPDGLDHMLVAPARAAQRERRAADARGARRTRDARPRHLEPGAPGFRLRPRDCHRAAQAGMGARRRGLHRRTCYRIGEPVERTIAGNLRTLYPLTEHTDLEAVRKSVNYQLSAGTRP